MLLTITTTQQPATDLGYLLHKNPAHLQSFSLTFGQAHVFYPEASDERCTAALLLDIDPVRLVRGPEKSQALEQYVNDRPYVASSFFSVAIADVFGTALNGRCSQRPELATTPLPLHATLTTVPCHGGEVWLRRLFEPLGYTMTVASHLLDEQYPEWGTSSYFTITLDGLCRLSELLTHIYVLVPVLDDNKHYWIGDAEVDKLLKRGQGWLETHPEREQIAYRYLKHRSSLVRAALSRLVVEEAVEEAEDAEETKVVAEGERPIGLHEQRLAAVMTVLRECGAKRVLDLGCGEGKLIKLLMQEKSFTHIVGLDVSSRVLELARDRLRLERLPTAQKGRVSLIHGALTYRDRRLEGYDAAAVVEVIEHLDQPRLAAFERVLFEFAKPLTVVVTTPNAEYNGKFATLSAGKFRHKDHRFEWTRPEFQAWANRIADRFGYTVQTAPIGPEDADVGAPSQMGVFTRQA